MLNPNWSRVLWGLGLLGLLGCSAPQNHVPKALNIEQQWQLQPGDRLGSYSISSGLGDIAIELGNDWLYMPSLGKIEPLESSAGLGCALVSSPEIPAYQVRLCGLDRVQWGDRQRGDKIGKGEQVALAMLRKQADGTWAMVEPATELLEQFLRGNKRAF